MRVRTLHQSLPPSLPPPVSLSFPALPSSALPCPRGNYPLSFTQHQLSAGLGKVSSGAKLAKTARGMPVPHICNNVCCHWACASPFGSDSETVVVNLCATLLNVMLVQLDLDFRQNMFFLSSPLVICIPVPFVVYNVQFFHLTSISKQQ